MIKFSKSDISYEGRVVKVKVLLSPNYPKAILKKAIADSARLYSLSLNQNALLLPLINKCDIEYKNQEKNSDNCKKLYDMFTELDENGSLMFDSINEYLDIVRNFKLITENIDHVFNNLRFNIIDESLNEITKKKPQP